MTGQFPKLSKSECETLRDVCSRRVKDLEKLIDKCTGSLYPRIMAAEAERIETLYEKLTGQQLDDESK